MKYYSWHAVSILIAAMVCGTYIQVAGRSQQHRYQFIGVEKSEDGYTRINRFDLENGAYQTMFLGKINPSVESAHWVDYGTRTEHYGPKS